MVIEVEQIGDSIINKNLVDEADSDLASSLDSSPRELVFCFFMWMCVYLYVQLCMFSRSGVSLFFLA